MAEPGTKVTGETPTTRTVGGVEVEQTTIRWNATERISVDYSVGDVDLYADTEALTSFDEPLTDEELRELLTDYGLLGYRLTTDDPSELVGQMLGVAIGRIRVGAEQGTTLVAAMLDAVLTEDARAARPAIEIVRAGLL